jgi:hypothetical protein
MAAEEIIDQLYGLPLAEFTSARNEAARELRAAGRRDAAEQVKALRKPTAAAGAVNVLVREHREEVEQFLRAATLLRDAQFSGKGDLATATRQEHEALERLTRIGGETVRQTLLAAAVDDDAAQQLRAARLERELEPRGFGTLLAHAGGLSRAVPVTPPAAVRPMAPAPSRAQQTPVRPERKQPDDGAARARLHDAKTALLAAEAEERQARRHWEQTRRELEKARDAVEDAQGDLDGLRGT